MSIDNPKNIEEMTPEKVRNALENLIKDIKGEEEGGKIIEDTGKQKKTSLPLAESPDIPEKKEGEKKPPMINIDKFKKRYGKDAEVRSRSYKDNDQDDKE